MNITSFLKKNAGAILTVIGAVGVVATAVMSAKATPKAIELLEEAKSEKGEELTLTEKVVTAAPAYIPSAGIGVATLVCIFGANVLTMKQQATLASAYALLNRSYATYKQKAGELYGDDANAKICTAVAEEQRTKRYYERRSYFMNHNTLKLIGLIATTVGLVANLVSTLTNDELMKTRIDKAVAEKVSELKK